MIIDHGGGGREGFIIFMYLKFYLFSDFEMSNLTLEKMIYEMMIFDILK